MKLQHRWVLSLVAFVVIIGVQFSYSHALFNYSLQFEPRIQEGASPAKVKFWQIYSKWALNLSFVPMFIVWPIIG